MVGLPGITANSFFQVPLDLWRIFDRAGETAGLETKVAWSAVETIATTPAHAFFIARTPQGIVVPRRAFADDRAFDALVEMARGYRTSSR